MSPRLSIPRALLALAPLAASIGLSHAQEPAGKKIVVQGQGALVIQGQGAQGNVVVQGNGFQGNVVIQGAAGQGKVVIQGGAPAPVAQPAAPARPGLNAARPGFVRIANNPAAAAPSAPPEPVLTWKDGNTLPGKLEDISPTHVIWRNPTFLEPIRLSWDSVQLIGKPNPEQTKDAFRFATKDGSHFYGRPTRLEGPILHVESSRFGSLHLRKDALLLIQRIRDDDGAAASLIFQGPQGDALWTTSDNNQQRNRFQSDDGESKQRPPDFQQGPAGTLESRIWNRTVQHPLELPEECDISFVIRSNGRPDFMLSFGTKTNKGVAIETWDDELVAHGGVQGVFKRLATLDRSARHVAVSLRWNSRAGEAVFRIEGQPEPLTFRGLDLPTGGQPGITLSSKGLNLTLEDLRITKPEGESVPPPAPTSPNTLILKDGRSLAVETIEPSATGLTVRGGNAAAPVEVAWNDIRTLRLSGEPVALNEQDACIQFADGTLLHASSARREGSSLFLEAAFADGTFPCLQDGLRLMRGATKKAPDTSAQSPDALAIGGLRLRGKGVFSQGSGPMWLFPGASSAVTPKESLPMRLTRSAGANPDPAQATSTGPDSAGASREMFVFTRNGEVLPGRVDRMDADHAHLQSALFRETVMPRESLSALYFNPFAGLGVTGFKEGWKLAKGREGLVTHKDGILRIEPGAAWVHPQVMRCNEIAFTLRLRKNISDIGNVSAVAVTPFSDGSSAGLPQLMVAAFGSGRNINVGVISPGEDNPSRSHSMNLGDATDIPIRLRVMNREVEIYVGGERMPLNLHLPSKRNGNGLLVEPGRYFGNNSRTIELTGFSAKADSRHPVLPALEAESRKQVLSIPRFRKEEPPRHLLVSTNGDALRGYIERTDEKSVTLKMGDSTHEVPVERLQAAIWLTRPSASQENAATEASSPRGKTLAKLDRPIQIFQVGGPVMSHIFQIRAQDNSLEIEVDSAVSANQTSKVIRGDAGDFTVGAYLRKICERFEVDQEIDNDGKVHIRQKGAAAESVRRPRAYILANNPLLANGIASITELFSPDPPSLNSGGPNAKNPVVTQSLSAAKELGAREGEMKPTWEPGTRQLTATVTPEGHERLLKVLEGLSGKAPFQPTHWVSLRGGAFFALALEGCANERIRGRHATLGACEFAASDLLELVNFPGTPPPFVQSFTDWRQENAPEPDIPRAAQEASSVEEMFNFGK